VYWTRDYLGAMSLQGWYPDENKCDRSWLKRAGCLRDVLELLYLFGVHGDRHDNNARGNASRALADCRVAVRALALREGLDRLV